MDMGIGYRNMSAERGLDECAVCRIERHCPAGAAICVRPFCGRTSLASYSQETSPGDICLDLRGSPCAGHRTAVCGHQQMDQRQHRPYDSACHTHRPHPGIRSTHDIRNLVCSRRGAIPGSSGQQHFPGRTCLDSPPRRKQKELRLGEAHQLPCCFDSGICLYGMHIGKM